MNAVITGNEDTYYVTVNQGIYSTRENKLVAGESNEFNGSYRDGRLAESR